MFQLTALCQEAEECSFYTDDGMLRFCSKQLLQAEGRSITDIHFFFQDPELDKLIRTSTWAVANGFETEVNVFSAYSNPQDSLSQTQLDSIKSYFAIKIRKPIEYLTEQTCVEIVNAVRLKREEFGIVQCGAIGLAFGKL